MKNIEPFKVGDIIRVVQKVTEGKKERLIPFKGRVIKTRGAGSNASFTVRQTIEGMEVERIFPFMSPTIAKVEKLESPKKKLKRANIVGIHKKIK